MKPILFSGPMVCAILGGRKTQTRRMVKPQPVPFGKSWFGGTRQGWKFDPEGINRSWNDDDKDPYRGEPLATMAMRALCPYGKPGDLLWVKETFATLDCHHGQVVYRADGQRNLTDMLWKSPIFMPRKASRITLEVVAVRVERLHDISDQDAIAEGIGRCDGAWESYSPKLNRCVSPVTSYRTLWESVNGPGSWAANHWVWVVEFKPKKGTA